MTTGLKNGYTTGSCAAGAAKAAVSLLLGFKPMKEVEVRLPNGAGLTLPVTSTSVEGGKAVAGVKKYSGDDPDATDGVTVFVQVELNSSNTINFVAGEGVGTVTKKGLQIPPGEPAINPVPRGMITAAVRELTDAGATITVSIPGGEEIAKNTFNPRLGVLGGLSILGTTGIVRPYSHSAIKESLKCALEVSLANGGPRPVLTAGNIGTKSARAIFSLPSERVVEVGNEWGFMLDCAAGHPIEGLLIVGHPGKLAKLTAGFWDTHSSRSPSSAPVVAKLAKELTGKDFTEIGTADGIFSALSAEEGRHVAEVLAKNIAEAARSRMRTNFLPEVALVDMRGNMLGSFGDLKIWRA